MSDRCRILPWSLHTYLESLPSGEEGHESFRVYIKSDHQTVLLLASSRASHGYLLISLIRLSNRPVIAGMTAEVATSTLLVLKPLIACAANQACACLGSPHAGRRALLACYKGTIAIR